ncbi:MAG: FtsX-like permease family protein [Thermoplasmata archaeon]|nr:FtsX-like permease family protein [Thermoplasmata archaeon]MCI4361706.1 FtsX-like permease family protein [Thermoplasmata archaeon]
MAISVLLVVPLGLLGIVLGISGLLAATHRLTFRIAMRNVRRGGSRTVLVLLGLLVGTTIISGSLVVGDTVNAVNVHGTYLAYQGVDEAIYNQSLVTGDYQFLPYSTYLSVAHAVSQDPGVSAVTPMILGTATVFDRTTGLPQPGLNLVGADPNSSGALGDFHADDGAVVTGPNPGSVILDDVAASDLNASVGDHVRVVGRVGVELTVQAIVSDNSRGLFLFGSDAFVDLAAAQAIENVSSEVNVVAVTNSGGAIDGAANSPNVSAAVNTTLAGLGLGSTLSVHDWLSNNLSQAVQSGSSLVTLFLVLGLFSIVAGAMLIVGIFVMIAEERKGEMGMLRAIGLDRRQLVYTYYFEGLAYSLGSALAGTILGLGVGFGIVYAFATIFSGGSVSALTILDSFTVQPSSLVIAYVSGFLLTLVTVTVASSRVSRLNIVRAIRSIPEPPPTLRIYTYLAYLGVLVTAVGGVLFATTFQGTSDVTDPTIGGGLLILGGALVASRFVPNRAAFTGMAVALLLWGGLEPLRRAILGSHHSGTIFVFFVEGILMVLGAVLLYSFNSDVVVEGVALLFRGRPRSVPVARIGLSYPSRRPFRTAINLTIFGLVLFTIVGVATIGSSIQSGLDATIQSESGGYTFFAYSQNPIPDLPGAIANNSTLAHEFSTVVPLDGGALSATIPGFAGPFVDDAFAAPPGLPVSETIAGTAKFNFTASANGSSSAAVWADLADQPGSVVVSNQYNPGGFSFSGGGPHPSTALGSQFVLANPDTGVQTTLTVIGILSESFVSGFFLNPATAAKLGVNQTNAFFLTTSAGVSAVTAAQHAKAAFFAFGLVILDFVQVLQSSIASTEAIIGLLEVFVALGLGVGIAAMGILALRAVVERRAEIGMLRATGFTQGMILRAFLLEYSFVALLGILIGTALGIVLDWDASQGAIGFLTFAVPWANLATVVLAAYALTLLAILGPSLRAARLPPAEAIRYSE